MPNSRLRILEEELLRRARELLSLKGLEHDLLFEDLPAGRRLMLSIGSTATPREAGAFRLMMMPAMPVWPKK